MKLLLRADAGPQVGTGHVMRTLALAQVWRKRGGEVRLLAASLTKHLSVGLAEHGVRIDRLNSKPGSTDDAATTKALAEEWNADWVVLDGYRFGSTYQEMLASDIYGRLVIDDYGHAGRYAAEIVLNQNLYAKGDDYAQRAEGAKLLLGPSYALLREEYWPWRSWRRPPPEGPARVLITMGGTDPADATGRVLEALRTNSSLDIVAIVGGANPRTYPERPTRPSVRVRRNVTSMPAHMCWAHVAFAAGGTTALELLFMQLPSALVVLADNQMRVVQSLERKKLGLSLGSADSLGTAELNQALHRLLRDEEVYRCMAERGAETVDGWGSERVVDAMLGRGWSLRPAAESDAETLWRWANDPITRSVSLNPEPIPWAVHLQWLASKLEDPNTDLWLAVDEEGKPFGQVRFDCTGHEAVISVGLDPAQRGAGFGSQLIRQSSDRIMRIRGVGLIRAYIKPGNVASQRAFARAGYKVKGETTVKDQTMVEMTYSAKEVECDV